MAFAKKKVEEKVLDVDASMQGTMNFKDPVNLHINGRFEGNLQTKGNLTIGQSAIVSADITGDAIVIAGRVKGKIIAKKLLSLLPTAIVEGDISPVKLSVAEGAIFEGRCMMLHDFMNAEELSRYLEVEIKSVLDWASSGKLPGSKDQDSWKFERKAIDAWIASGEIGK